MLRESISAQTAAVAIAVIGLNIHFGYTGLLNMGQSGFMMLGAYGFSISIWQGLPMVVGILLGLPGGVRLRADPRRADAEAARRLPRHRHHLGRRDPQVHRPTGALEDFTGAAQGIPGSQYREPFTDLSFFGNGTFDLGGWLPTLQATGVNGWWVRFVAWLLVAICCVLVWLLVRSPWGRLLRGIREDEDAIRSLGKNVFAIKMQALIIGGLFGALGGIVYILPASMQPDAMGRSLTFFCWTALLLGGAATVFGPVIGAVLFFALRIFIQGASDAVGAQQHHEHRPDRPVRLDLRRRRADAAGDLQTTRNPRRQEGAAVQCLTRPTVAGTPGPLADPEARRALMADVAREPGSAKPDPILEVDHIIRNFGGMTAVHVDHLEVQRGIITALIGPNGAGKTTFFNLITGLRQAELGEDGRALVLRGPQARQDLRVVGRPGRHGAHLPADQVPQPDDGDGQHDAGRPRAARREPAHLHVQVDLGRAGEGDRGEGQGAARTGSSCTPRRTTTPAACPAASASCSRWRGP